MVTSLSQDFRYVELSISLHQIEAMFDVLNSSDLSELKLPIIAEYFSIANDILFKAQNACNKLANLPIQQQNNFREESNGN